MSNKEERKNDKNNKEPALQTIEVEGKTVQDAIKQALTMLQANENEVTFHVLKEERKGLFGMEGAEKAKIKVTLKKKK